ncbi:MAG: hypothetical protein K0S33_3183 [Bacteroidetes bacterium]|jgi:hypothetical protein|nr:hypothetical protein [Bacteroidota bacterium]
MKVFKIVLAVICFLIALVLCFPGITTIALLLKNLTSVRGPNTGAFFLGSLLGFLLNGGIIFGLVFAGVRLIKSSRKNKQISDKIDQIS